ncbi:chromosome segregation protein SMC [Desulfosporosinus fructosivorans]|uniref:Chromosome partition protein Smc n=1 Tax=Desulfosporosinus fructosivorans TaxID=2018669 RepID=A0A4Z0RBI0_9FIRM|nr:chromosome segregation protein SMC [Desulfosporosinus fructosivorans]TGE40160.1 chromosome segregation protein SMC [Desulfosporosinus fructosivorans]
MAKPEDFPVFLKGIHIQGFKSFADRVKLELGHGLSVIVGPNGSGKSNVADAVRWVLGEQSAKSLRGVKMEDVIFSGSTQRRPVGMAEVSLIFDNTTGIFPLDFREITITRRVYRDGDGQYLINNASCRLRDIQELFMDTGAGKEGFSIIGQGRIEEILNLKSEERRSLIEEAAGITKFRYRKREALKRLDATISNLQRLDDIVREIEAQLTPLAAQAQVAEQSLALSTEQRRLEIQLTVLDISEGKQKLSLASKDSETLQSSLVEAQALLRLEESKNIEDKVLLKEIEDDLQRMQGEGFQAEQALDALKHEMSIRAERSKYLEEQIAWLTDEIQVDEEKIRNLNQRISTLAAKQAVLKHTVEESQRKVLEQEEKLNVVRERNLAEVIERIKADLFQALSEQANCANELTGAQHTLASLEQQVLQIVQEQGIKVAERQTLSETSEAQEKELRQIERQAIAREEEMLSLRTERDQLKGLQQENNAGLQKHKTLTEQSRARMHALRSLENSLEGYQRGVREVMLAKKKGIKDCIGLCGTVAELITVQEKYELALETALGAGLQNVVAENEKGAKAAISYLKVHQFGRVTFLPLDIIQGNRMSVSQVVERDPGYIGVAVDLVTYDLVYKPAMEFLLGRIVVVSDMNAATRIAKASGYRLRIVTLEGDQVHPGGSLSGGSVQRKGGNLLARSREIDSLHVALVRLEKDLSDKEQEYSENDLRLRAIQENMDNLSLKQREDKEHQVMLKTVHENVLNQLGRLESDLMGLNLRNQDNMAQKDALCLRLTSLTERLDIAERTSVNLREEYNRREQEAKVATGEIESHGEQLTQEKIRLAKWEQELNQCTEQLGHERSIIRENESSLQLKKLKQVGFQENCQTVEAEQGALNQQLEKHSLAQEAQQYSLMQRRQEREGLAAGLLKLEQEILSKRQLEHALEQRLHANELRVVRYETECQAGETRLVEEFSLTWEEAIPYQTEEERSVLWRRVQALKQKIDDLGPINQAAIEEYPKMLARKVFMLAQQDDLVEADQTLRQVISELDKTMSERFIESFHAVNGAFQEVFKELFCGGNAELHLVDPEHLLETGVEIIAQPPGKKPQLLSLLSGGERALTAIAILFALLRVKPSPFCILDEIEASLDDANVQRFAQYIHRLSDSTQFVVISHRKGTMESADVLYGITMEESGVSKLLSVQLDKREDTLYSA